MVTTMTKTTQDTFEQLAVSPEQTLERRLPATPFPRRYVHSVFNNPEDAVQAFLTLLGAGYDGRDIRIMAGQDYEEAVERGQTLLSALTSNDLDDYLREARRGGHILAVRLYRYEQMLQVRDLLAPHHARHMKYIDTWTVAQLI